MPAIKTARTFTGGRFALIVDGEFWGLTQRLSGGIIRGAVATESMGPEHIRKKHLAAIIHEPFVVDVGIGMSKGLYGWISTSFERGLVPTAGEFVACDNDNRAMSAREFVDGVITAVTFPTLDGSSKEPAYMTVKIDPEEIHYKPGDGSLIAGEADRTAKNWLVSNFRFELGDLPCSRVARIDSFTWKQTLVEEQAVRSPDVGGRSTRLEVPNLKVTVSMADVAAWQDWHRNFVIEGKCSDADELTGAITFLAPDLLQELARIDLQHVGLISLDTTGWEANTEEVARFTVELYVEQMTFDYMVADA